MDTRKLSLFLTVGGVGAILLAFVWFVAAYAGAMEMAADLAGDELVMEMMSCLYSSSPICQGAGMLDDRPAYSPVLFWIGVIGLLAGIAVRFAAGKSDAPVSDAAETREIMGFIPPAQFARYGYILSLSGAVAGLILTPLAVVAVAGFALALLGLTVFRSRLSALDTQHLGLICLVFAAATLLLLVARGSFLFLLAVLAQIACFYTGFNSYRHGRMVTVRNVRDEFLMALKVMKPERSMK